MNTLRTERHRVITRESRTSLIDTSKAGLVSAYGFSNGSLNDIVGSNDLTQSGPIDTVKSRLGTGFSMSTGNLSVATPSFQGSPALFFSVWLSPLTADPAYWLMGYYENTSFAIGLRVVNTGFAIFDDIDNSNNILYDNSNEISIGQIHNVVWGFDSSNVCKMWVNGTPRDNDQSASASISTVTGELVIGDRRSIGFDPEATVFYSCEVFTSDLTDSDAAEIYNRAQKIVSYFDQGVTASGNTITSGFVENTPFRVESGSYRIVEENIDGYSSKVLECVTPGICYMDSKSLHNSGCAFGEWKFIVKSGGGSLVFQIMSDSIGAAASTDNYNFFYASDATVQFREEATTHIDTSPTTYSTSTYHTVKITRRYDGLFTVYVDGASIGTYTDPTPLVADYMVMDNDAGDKIVLWSENPEYTFSFRPFAEAS